MGMLRKNKEPKEPKPIVPKPVTLSPEDKAVLAGQVARYRDAFENEGYDYVAESAYLPRTLMTPRFEDFDHRGVHALDTPPVGKAINIAVGQTDGRIYATWMFVAPLVVGAQIHDRMVQVSGIYLGDAAPTGYLTSVEDRSASSPEFDGLFSRDAVEVFEASSLSTGVWVEHGWILTDFPVIQPDINIAIAAWKHLSAIVDILEADLRSAGCDFGVHREPVHAVREIFPTFGW